MVIPKNESSHSCSTLLRESGEWSSRSKCEVRVWKLAFHFNADIRTNPCLIGV